MLGAAPMTAPATPLLEGRELRKHFLVPTGSGRQRLVLKAVDGVSLQMAPGETVGLVGESGCGKSTLGRLLLGLLRPTAGYVRFEGREVGAGRRADQREMHRRVQVIFQDPYASLNPRMNIGSILAEPFIIHRIARGREALTRAGRILERVGLSPDDLWRYPHEFSGGQRQRIGIARAVALEPRLIIADEPVSSLDVSIQAQILNLLLDLREETGVAYLFISHDLSVIRHLSDRVAVMYLGRLVEEAPVEQLYNEPLHPYTEALLAAIPTVDAGGSRRRLILGGDIPSPVSPPPGCHFHPRCPIRGAGCDTEYPPYLEKRPGRRVACHYRGN